MITEGDVMIFIILLGLLIAAWTGYELTENRAEFAKTHHANAEWTQCLMETEE